ncbi:MAG: serine/threonine protein kinase [Myxococcales bacterium]|nr:serine/threonine protein kinase [Myxococcales bacterium]
MGSLTEVSKHQRLSSGATVGRYCVRRELGAGGMGAVYEAVHVDLGKRVALKVLHPWIAEVPQIRSRFLLEGQAVARIRHPNVVDVYDVGQDVGWTYLVMELLDGHGLQEAIDARGRLSLSEIAEVLVPIASALGAAHQSGIVHRDVKPSNIFLSAGDFGEMVPKLLDFGISKVDEDSSDACCVLGTPLYMSPEQAFGSPAVDARSDQYSLGVIAYQCATGRLPFEADSLYWALHKVVEAAFEAPEELKAVDPAFEKFVCRSMARSPEDRFDTMTDFARALLHWGDDQLIAVWSPLFGGGLGPELSLKRLFMLPPPVWASSAEEPTSPESSIGTINEQQMMLADFGEQWAGTYSNSQTILSVVALSMGIILAVFTVNGSSSPSVAAVVTTTKDKPPPAEEYMMVSLEVEPPDAKLELNGLSVGRGLLHIRLPIDGSIYQLRITSPTYEPVVFMFREIPPPTKLSLRRKEVLSTPLVQR